jgi:hypothetical protein
MKYFKVVEVGITCWIMRYENEIETGRVLALKKESQCSVSVCVG